MHSYLLEVLQCPACHAELDWAIHERRGDRIERAEASCRNCANSYPVIEGIALFLTQDLKREDLWEGVNRELLQYLENNPAVERQLMETPVESLGPADQFYRALLLEERGDYSGARKLEELANEGLYTEDYLRCLKSQMEYMLEAVASSAGPIVDLASGRGYLVEKMARYTNTPLVATDFSPGVLQRDRRYFESQGIYERISLLACDVRQTPFKDQSPELLTSNLGLVNIREPGRLFEELRRIVSGRLLSISHFFPEGDGNAQIIKRAGLEVQVYRRLTEAGLKRAGFQVRLANLCHGLARATPVGVILAGAQVDGLPVVETELEWCVVEAT